MNRPLVNPGLATGGGPSLSASFAEGTRCLIASLDEAAGVEPDSLAEVVSAVKEDLRRRFQVGERPTVTDYLGRLPELHDADERILSLIYEEFCLLEECGEPADPDEFCGRYAPWRDSLASQLHYHATFSRALGASAQAPRFPAPGERFAGFHLAAEIGRGGTARVYLARDEALGERTVALKISPDRGGEAAIHGRLDHPHIVPVLSIVREAETGLRGLCMPFLPGVPLDRVIDHHRKVGQPTALTLQQAMVALAGPVDGGDALGPTWADYPIRGTYAQGVAWVASHLADALAHAHARSVLHRDLKPANVLLTLRGGPLLLDFNLAEAPSSPEQAREALRGGTLPYMAPEQLAAFLDPERWEQVGTAADLYALGLLIREFLTGERPDGPDPAIQPARAVATLRDRRLEPPLGPRASASNVPYALDAIVRRCLAPKPEDRYSNASALAEDLRRFLHGDPLRFVENPSRRETTATWLRRHRRGLFLLVGVLMMAAASPALVRLAPPRVSAEEYVDLAKQAIRGRRLVEAREHLLKALRLNPGLYTAHLALGLAELADEQFLLSLEHTRRAIALATSNHATGPVLAEAHLAAAEASILWAKALLDRDEARVAPKAAPIKTARKDRPAYLEAEYHYAQALEDLERAQASSADKQSQFVGHVLAAKRYAGLGDLARFRREYKPARQAYETAEREISLALEPYPGHQDALGLHAELQLSLGRLDLSEQRYRAAHESMSRALALVLGPPRLFEGDRLARYYTARGEVSLRWGDELQRHEIAQKERLKASGHPNPIAALPSRSESDAHYEAALRDAEAARLSSTKLKTRVLWGLVAVCAESGLGDAASRRDRYDQACAHYARAQAEIDAVLAAAPDDEKAKRYQKGIRERIKNDCTPKP